MSKHRAKTWTLEDRFVFLSADLFDFIERHTVFVCTVTGGFIASLIGQAIGLSS